MPYHVAKSDQCPASKPWACVKDATGEVMGCHATEADAENQMAALYSSEQMNGAQGGQALRIAAAQARAAAASSRSRPMTVPLERPPQPGIRFASQLRAEKTTRDGLDYYLVDGYASTVERGYEMWDAFGPYDEVLSAAAFERTLAARPEVVFRYNHTGTPMAGTRNGRLELWSDGSGLGDRAWLNPKRADVQLLIQAIEDDDVREQSFMFQITEGKWSDDFSEYRINEVDLDRGDVGPVTYGANPHTSIAQRSGEFLAAIPQLPPLVAREAYTLLSQRSDLTTPQPAQATQPTPVAAPKMGRSIAMVRTKLLVCDDED